MVKIEQIAGFTSCLTCVHRRPYPGSVKDGKTTYYRFQCGRAPDTGRELVRPEESCDKWDGITLNCE